MAFSPGRTGPAGLHRQRGAGVLGHDEPPGLARVRAGPGRYQLARVPPWTVFKSRGPALRLRPFHCRDAWRVGTRTRPRYVPVFLAGLKKGVGTTVAGTRWRTASTVCSTSTRVPVGMCDALMVARPIICFSTGDQVDEVMRPIWLLLPYTGTATREATA